MEATSSYLTGLKEVFQNLTPIQRFVLCSISTTFVLVTSWVYSCYRKPKLPLRSVPLCAPRELTETSPRRSLLHPHALLSTFRDWKEVTTVAQLLEKAASEYSTRPCLGSRPLIKIHVEEKEVQGKVDGQTQLVKKKWMYEERGPYKWTTFQEVYDKVHALSCGLRELGLQERSHLGIYCNTRPEWMLIAQSCFHTNIILVTVYANLGEEGLAYSLEQGETKCLFTSADLLDMVVKLKPELPLLETVIYVDTPKAGTLDTLKDVGIRAVSFDELMQLGSENDREATSPTSEDVAVIMYTSGTTGTPKGVIIPHGNLIATVASIELTMPLVKEDTYIAALPLAHVLELVAEITIIACGASIGYGSPKTLTDNLVRNCKGDLSELRPTLMAGVPLVWERIRKSALSAIGSSNALVRGMFDLAYRFRRFYGKSVIFDPILNMVIFNKFKAQIGGRIRLSLSGGASISAETHEFIRVCFGMPIVQGYGLTETCGASCLLPTDHPGYGVVGPPLPSVEIKLRDVEEMGYRATNLPNPQGEICVRGLAVSKGYYKLPEKTREDFDLENGWFFTGDIGEWKEDGCLSIIDRKKNLVKLAHGEYIALENMETRYKDSLFVENVCVFGNSDVEYPVAVIVPNKVNLLNAAKELGVDCSDFENVCKDRKVVAKVLASIVTAARASRLKDIEIVKAIHITADEWTPESGLLTAAMKLQRSQIYKEYNDQILALYRN